MPEIRAIADEYGLFVIEDNAQAIDARGDSFRIGELSDAVCISFIIQKNLGTYGDGGGIWTDHQFINDARQEASQPRLRPSATSTAPGSTAASTTSTPAS